MARATFRIWRGDASGGRPEDYETDVTEGMVVLDAIHQIQAESAGDLACRWNCKAGKCGSCSAEVNGMPCLMCMKRLADLPLDEPVTIEPMHSFPIMRDLVTDVSWNYAVKKKIKKFTPRPPDAKDGTWRMAQEDIDRVQEFRKCIECFLCQDVCHVLRDHHKHDEFIGCLSPEGFHGNSSAAIGNVSLAKALRSGSRITSLFYLRRRRYTPEPRVVAKRRTLGQSASPEYTLS